MNLIVMSLVTPGAATKLEDFSADRPQRGPAGGGGGEGGFLNL
jgi:hypothetical protein